jgi:hypothetical protein
MQQKLQCLREQTVCTVLQDLLHNKPKILGCLVQRKEGSKEDRKYDIGY